MKKKILIALMAIICSHVNAQLTNPSFLLNNGNDETMMRCPTWVDGSLTPGPTTNLGWYRSIGSPSLTTDCGGSLGAVKITAGSGSPYKQGLYQPYHFVSGQQYKVCYKFIKWDVSSANVEIFTTHTSPAVGSPCTALNCECMHTYASLHSQMISFPQNVNTNCANALSGSFTFTATNDEYLVIVITGTSFTGYQNYAVLDYVNVTRICTGTPDLYFGDGSTLIPGGVYDGHDNIYAGSFFGGSAPPVVTVTPSANTTFEAKYSVEFQHDFLAQVSSDGSFFAEINPNFICGDNCDEKQGPPPSREAPHDIPTVNSRHYMNSKANVTGVGDIAEDKNHKWKIYPNPNNGAFNIEAGYVTTFNVKVVSVLGATVYEQKIDNRSKASVALDAKLPSGTYTIYISNEDGMYIDKISVIK